MSIDPNAVSPLRRRMIEDTTIRRFTEETRGDDFRHVRAFAAFLGRSPELAEPEDLRRFQRHMAAGGARPATMNAAVSAPRFFFQDTLGRAGFGACLAATRAPERLPVVLSTDEVARLLGRTPGLKCQAALSVACGCGLRVPEIIHLKAAGIDSARMVIRVEQGIRTCRTASLGGHVARCTDCAHTAIGYNPCRNRHCPKCQGAAARKWLAGSNCPPTDRPPARCSHPPLAPPASMTGDDRPT